MSKPMPINKRRMQVGTGLYNFLNISSPVAEKASKIQKISFSNSADEILYNASLIGLHVSYTSVTAGDGNCFYRSVVEQL